jgi:hypothetical protein
LNRTLLGSESVINACIDKGISNFQPAAKYYGEGPERQAVYQHADRLRLIDVETRVRKRGGFLRGNS